MGLKNAWLVLVLAALMLVFTMESVSADGQGGKNDPKKGVYDPASTHYIVLSPVKRTGQERVFCLARGRCFLKSLTCPRECSVRKPKKNKKVKGCFIDCSSKCETTCKWRKANCNGYGSVCYDPRFVGGDGKIFYFHGAKGGNFALVSDDQFQINAHFIGTRPVGRSRDFTWVQALALMFRSHTLVVAAKKVSAWDDAVDALIFRWDGQEVTVPNDGEAEWRTTSNDGRDVVVERTDETNSVKISVKGVVEMDVKVVPITEEDDRAHKYRIPAGDAFAHLEMQFRFAELTEKVEGVLGQTYRPDYVSPVKTGVAMPMMGGEDKYQTPAFLSTDCRLCRFRRPRVVVVEDESMAGVAQY